MNPLRERTTIRIMKLGKYNTKVNNRLENWRETGFARRLWKKDHTLWFPEPVPELTDRMGWLFLPGITRDQLEDLAYFAEQVKSEEIEHVVLLGMGGSSLAPEVFQNVFCNVKGYPELIVLDSTHPSAVRSVEKRIDLKSTIFLVASKSGTTIETLSLFRYFWSRMDQFDDDPGRYFVAVTDPDTPLSVMANERGFRRIFEAPPDVGGRYSALSVFGLLPASLIGIDLHKFLDGPRVMSENFSLCGSDKETSVLALAAALGEITLEGRDKVTFLTSTSISSFPVWLEQLIAESTGKDGKGIVPIVNEPIMQPDAYDSDRFFIYMFVEGDDNSTLDKLTWDLESMGHPVVRIKLADRIDLSQEIYFWEIAVAAAGAVLRINPFNQPNVQIAKDLARKMMERARGEALIKEQNETVQVEDSESLSQALDSWIELTKEGDYLAIQAYLEPTTENMEALQEVRSRFLNRLRISTTLGFGPRFLHSTGQLHKGGPNKGLFLQLVDEPEEDLEVPETNYSFGSLIYSQALGDYNALKQLGRRVLRINLGRNVVKSLSFLSKLISR